MGASWCIIRLHQIAKETAIGLMQNSNCLLSIISPKIRKRHPSKLTARVSYLNLASTVGKVGYTLLRFSSGTYNRLEEVKSTYYRVTKSHHGIPNLYSTSIHDGQGKAPRLVIVQNEA